ncbi:eae-like domain protein, partial [Enterobacter asburiae]
MNNKELIKAGHELAKAISNDTPLIEIAKMVSNLAAQLDVQLARSNALAAENAGLRAACEDRRTFIMNGVQLGYIQVPTVETDPALETIRVAVSPQEPTPATDAF